MSPDSAASGSMPAGPLADFVRGLDALLQRGQDEAVFLPAAGELMRRLVAHDAWLPEAAGRADPVRYQQYPLHVDARRRFSVVSFVWGPGQFTPVHDHTVWGVIGMLRGAERAQRYELDGNGVPRAVGRAEVLRPGDVAFVSPRLGDVHQVGNVFDDQVSISVHAYGGDIGQIRRHVFTADGHSKVFVSGYSAAIPAN